MTAPPRVTCVVVAFGEVPTLPACVDSLLGSDGVDLRVVVVDNGAAEEVLDAVRGRRGVDVVSGHGNVGFGGGCNIGAATTDDPLLAFVNPDTTVERGALRSLAEVATRPGVGIATASLRLADRPELLNSGGGAIHFLGLGWADDFERPASEVGEEKDVAAASGAAMMMRREVFDEVGGFTEELFLYHEDAELSLRVWLAGYSVRFAPAAVAWHDYEFARNPRKMYFLERNRLCLLLGCFSTRLLIVLAPVLVAYEVGILLVAVTQGWGSEKLSGWRWIASHAGWMRRHRRRIQASRAVRDRDIARLLAPRFRNAPLQLPGLLRPADAVLAAYWRIVSRLL